MKRRHFITTAAQASAAVSILGLMSCKDAKEKVHDIAYVNGDKPLFFKISLAEWSFHRALRRGVMDNLDFAAKARSFGCEGLEYVNGFFKDKAEDKTYLKELNLRANSEGVQNVLIMIDGEGDLASADKVKRNKAVENHKKWVHAAQFLGCHSIRVNLSGSNYPEVWTASAIDGLSKLASYANVNNINVIVENHGGLSSNAAMLVNVIQKVNASNCGVLPDFGNFCIRKEDSKCVEDYDRYKGVEEMMPYAKAVSAKSYDFDENGDETLIDYIKMLQQVKKSGYTGFIGIEYEGNNVSEEKGIELTKNLLIKVAKQL